MKRAFMSTLIGLLPTVIVCAQTIALSDKNEILRLEQLWNDAHLSGDVKALDALWADDITIIVPGMRPLTKASALEMWRAVPIQFTRYESTATAVRIFDDTAVVSGLLIRTRNFGGKVAEEHWQFTKVYKRSVAIWRIIAFHASEAVE